MRVSRSMRVLWFGFLSLACVAGPARAQLEAVRVARELESPVFVAAPPGDPRLFVVERPGRIRAFDTRSSTVFETPFPPPFLDIDEPGHVSTSGEGGLLGLAFAPDYATSGVFYVYYTRPDATPPGFLASVVSRFTVTGDPATSNDANEASETVIFELVQPFDNHNGGTIAIRDGFLYLGLGDGGDGGDPEENAQDDASLLGKMLRLDLSIPNPDTGDWTIYAKGLRNPWRFSFDRATGDLYIGDVGQSSREEINAVPAGAGPGLNFGWDVMEGDECFESPDPGEPPCNDPSFTDPIYTWTRAGSACATGGSVYRGRRSRALVGTYFFADGCGNRFFSLRWTAGQGLIEAAEIVRPDADVGTINSPVAIGEDAAGELYYVDLGGGEVFRLVPEPGAAALAVAALGALGALTRRRE
jgi:hypothetical protein